MDIKLVKRAPDGAEFLFEGRMDSVTAPEAEELIMPLLADYQTVIFNFKKLEYVSSAGLRVIKKTHMAMRKKNGDLIVKSVAPMVMEVFEMTGFAGLLQFED